MVATKPNILRTSPAKNSLSRSAGSPTRGVSQSGVNGRAAPPTGIHMKPAYRPSLMVSVANQRHLPWSRTSTAAAAPSEKMLVLTSIRFQYGSATRFAPINRAVRYSGWVANRPATVSNAATPPPQAWLSSTASARCAPRRACVWAAGSQ